MRSFGAWLLLALAPFGCGPAAAPAPEVSSTSGESASDGTSGEVTSGIAVTGSSASETGTTSRGGVDESSGSGAAATDSGSSDDATTTGGRIGPIAYCADRYIGGYDRVNIWQRDETADVCTLVRLILDGPTAPDYDGPTTLKLPDHFAVERIVLQQGASECGTDPHGGVHPTAVEGAVTGDEWLETVDIQATVDFDPVEPWIPAQVVLEAQALIEQNACDVEDAWVDALG